VPIHGIGTQMHMNINTSKTNIDDMFKEAATDLQIKVTEIRYNNKSKWPSNASFAHTSITDVPICGRILYSKCTGRTTLWNYGMGCWRC
jgi:GH35 family endo-1,4-beta-xylanase